MPVKWQPYETKEMLRVKIEQLEAQAASDRGKLEAMKKENEQVMKESKFFMTKGSKIYDKYKVLKRKFKEVDPGLTDSEDD